MRHGLEIVDETLVTDPRPRAKSTKRPQPSSISHRVITNIAVRLHEGKQVHRSLPTWGRVHIDRQLPFMIVYRQPAHHPDPGTSRLVAGEASYLMAPGDRGQYSGVAALTKTIANTLGGVFGAFLIVELWAGRDELPEGTANDFGPYFRIFAAKSDAVSATVDRLAKSLKQITTKRQRAQVEVVSTAKIRPPGLPELIPPREAKDLNIHHLGIEVKPVYRAPDGGSEFPLIRRALHRGLARALRRGVFEFTKGQTTRQPRNYQSLGPRSFVKAVWDVDRQLAEVSNEFDFLLSITPTNSDAAWAAFKRKRFYVEPVFTYRPLPVEPALLKRSLFAIQIERVEDPTLADLFRAQQFELDRKITMLTERGTARFRYGSLQLFGKVDDQLYSAAEAILFQFPPRTRDDSRGKPVDATTFARRAMQRIEQYRNVYPKLQSRVEVRDDITGLMVSRGNLLIGKSTKTPSSRVEALIAHEVGTHMVTYLNGRAQRFRQLYIGLPGYDELQEGLAVLAEYLVGGLTRPRLRLLAARVIAARHMTDGASFVDVFRLLNGRYRFAQRTAFGVTMRTFRSGGFVKDAIYLRGLLRLLEHVRSGDDLETLFIGKFGLPHLSLIKELQWRKVLTTPPLRPHYLDSPEIQKKLERLRGGVSVLDLVEQR